MRTGPIIAKGEASNRFGGLCAQRTTEPGRPCALCASRYRGAAPAGARTSGWTQTPSAPFLGASARRLQAPALFWRRLSTRFLGGSPAMTLPSPPPVLPRHTRIVIALIRTLPRPARTPPLPQVSAGGDALAARSITWNYRQAHKASSSAGSDGGFFREGRRSVRRAAGPRLRWMIPCGADVRVGRMTRGLMQRPGAARLTHDNAGIIGEASMFSRARPPNGLEPLLKIAPGTAAQRLRAAVSRLGACGCVGKQGLPSPPEPQQRPPALAIHACRPAG